MPPFAPAADTCARMTVESNICTRCARSLKEASASKKVLGRQRSPRNVVDRKIVQGFEKLAVVLPLVPTPRAAGMKHLDHKHPIFFGHLR